MNMDKLLTVDWAGLFTPTHSIAEMIVRGTIMYVALFLILRLLMKRQSGSIGTADLLVIIIIADAAQNAFAKEYQSITEGVVLVLTIIFWDFLIDWLNYRFPALHSLLQSPPVRLIRNGGVLRKNLRQELMTLEDLHSELRKHGIEDISDVASACIEEDGEISVVKRPPRNV